MVIIHDFKIPIKKYVALGKNNSFPQLFICPRCGDHLIKNGFYNRYLITPINTLIIVIRRLKCKHCGKSISILPSFVMPGFQRSLDFIFQIIKDYLIHKKKSLYDRGLFFYRNRFFKNLNGIASYFRMTKYHFLKLPPSKNKKAIKLIQMIDYVQIHTFSQKFFNRLNITFMAH